MKKIRKIACLCAIMLLLSGCAASKAAAVPESTQSKTEVTPISSLEESSLSRELRDAKAILKDIILLYGYKQENASEKIEDLFGELAETDVEQYELWREIYSYWQYTKNEQEINYGKLPEDLPTGNNLCLVALGYKLNEDGSIRPELEGRLKVLLDCANQYPNAYIACTGGGTASGNKNVTEAGQMADWLMEHGISKDRIIVEDKSMTTAQNAMNTYKILRQDYPWVDTVAIVSSDYHIGWGSVLYQAVCMLNREADGSQPVSVVTNAASSPEKPENYPFSFQAAGLLELIGDDTAWDIYYYKFDESQLK